MDGIAAKKDRIIYESTAGIATTDMGQAVDEMKMTAKNRRRIFERRWYDNSFFDDGFHFRYLSRSSNKIVDLSERSTIYTPQRSIPKASRQIRGISNLLMSSDPTPTVYPKPVHEYDYRQPMVPKQPEQSQQQPSVLSDPRYISAVRNAKEVAQKKGMWLLDEWQKDDGSGENILDKLALMTILTMKHGVSYLKIWPDDHEESIRTSVRDAFDIYLLGNLTSIYHSPFMIDAFPRLIADIKADPLFDKGQVAQITPDNKKASSEIKEAYLQSRYGRDTTSDQSATLIQNEAFIKEYVNKDNITKIMSQDNAGVIMKERDMGSPIIRQTFTAGGVWLYDAYTNLSEYPFVDYRVEPGPIYQVPMIERFMPANKSLDSVVSRIERYTHTMTTGAWLKHRGENFKINNIAGGQIIEYDTTPPTQAQIAPIPPFVFEFVGLLTNFIEEQGVSTTTLGKLPSGVKGNAAIESLKESEYANLVIASRRLKATCKKIAQKCFEIADENFITPHPVAVRKKGTVVNFNVIGESALKQRKKLKIDTPDVIVLSKNDKVDIDIGDGSAYTRQGAQSSAQAIMNTMIELQNAQAIPPQALQVVAEKYLESYQFGGTEEFMDAIDASFQNSANLTEQQMTMLKTAVLEALKDAGEVGQEASEKRIMENKLGLLSALKDANLIKGMQGQQQSNTKPLAESLNIKFSDLPADSQKQVLNQLGISSEMLSPSASKQLETHANIMNNVINQQQQQIPQGGGQ